MEKIALLPGGFKPPHAGHYNMAKWLASNTDANTIIVKVGANERNGITREMSLKLWDLYRSTDKDPSSKKLTILPSTSNSPVSDVYDFVEQEAPKNSIIYLGVGEKDFEDKRFANISKFAEPKGIQFFITEVPPQSGGVSGTDMRDFIDSNRFQDFAKYIPDHLTAEQKEQAWNIVTGLEEDFSKEWWNEQLKEVFSDNQATINGQSIPLEIMTTPEEQMRGMMGRKELEGGMLFPYGEAGKRPFHMKNCKIPLDIVFINQDEITNIHSNCPPCKEDNCPQYTETADNVLELPGGYCQQNNINVGNYIELNSIEEDLYNPNDHVLDYMKSSEWKAGMPDGPKDDIPRGYKYKRGGMYTGGGMGFGGMYEDQQTQSGKKKLRVFDFDDTIAETETNIIVKHANGEIEKLTSGEYAVYQTQEGDEFDFSEFDKVIKSATPIQNIVTLLQKDLKDPTNKVTVLTARMLAYPVRRYLKTLGLDVYVVAVGGVEPERKANWIKDHIENKGYDDIVFIDDSEPNRKAIEALRDEYPGAKIEVYDPESLRENLKLNELENHEIKFFAMHADILKQLNTPNFKLRFIELQQELEGERLEALEYFWDEFFSNLEDSCEIEGSFDKKVREIKYGGQHHLSQYMDQIKLDHGPQQYRDLQTLMSQQKDEEVNNWLKTKGYMNETRLFSKDWWLNIINESLLTEGGAAGHMAHPFDLPNVTSGEDLKDVFVKAAISLKTSPGAVKIDGVNSSIRLVDLDGQKQFVMDRGSKKPLDIKGITKADLEDRFKPGHGMVKVGGEVLDMFNEALPSIQNDLMTLDVWEDPNILFNMEYVSGKTNVQDYGSNFIAIHGLNRVKMIEEPSAKTGKTLIKRFSTEFNYDKAALQSLLDNLAPIAKERGFEVYGSVPTEMDKEPNFSSALSKQYTVNSNEGDKTQTLDRWLGETNSIPKDDFIFINANGTKKKVGAVSKQVYLAILKGENVDELFEEEDDKQKAIDGFTTYLATEKLGDEILKVLNSPMGSVEDHEGVVIRDKNIYSDPFKITGKFILGGLISDF